MSPDTILVCGVACWIAAMFAFDDIPGMILVASAILFFAVAGVMVAT